MNEPYSEPKDSVTLLREYAAVRIFHKDIFARMRTLMTNCADEIESLRTYVTQEDWDKAQGALRDALKYVKDRTPPLSTAGTDIALQRKIEAALCPDKKSSVNG